MALREGIAITMEWWAAHRMPARQIDEGARPRYPAPSFPSPVVLSLPDEPDELELVATEESA